MYCLMVARAPAGQLKQGPGVSLRVTLGDEQAPATPFQRNEYAAAFAVNGDRAALRQAKACAKTIVEWEETKRPVSRTRMQKTVNAGHEEIAIGEQRHRSAARCPPVEQGDCFFEMPRNPRAHRRFWNAIRKHRICGQSGHTRNEEGP